MTREEKMKEEEEAERMYLHEKKKKKRERGKQKNDGKAKKEVGKPSTTIDHKKTKKRRSSFVHLGERCLLVLLLRLPLKEDSF